MYRFLQDKIEHVGKSWLSGVLWIQSQCDAYSMEFVGTGYIEYSVDKSSKLLRGLKTKVQLVLNEKYIIFKSGIKLV